jgi:cell division protein FtsN
MLVCGVTAAQQASLRTEMKKGEALRATYRFKEAIAVFSRLFAAATDSSLRADIAREIIRCENGAQLLQFTFTPQVVGKATVPLHNFYACYDLNLPGGWAATPGTLLARGDTAAVKPFLFVPAGKFESLYFSSRGTGGRNGWDIYETHRLPNNEWSLPERLGEAINTPFDERFPYVTPDGQTLYFSSTGHYGMGGFDLYKSTLHNGEWSAPENLGFPLSSVCDDLLYVPDADGLYACFVSTRDAVDGYLSIYKIALAGTPVKRALTVPAEIMQLESLPLATPEPAADTTVAAPDIPAILAIAQQELDALRTDYAAATSEQQQRSLAIKIELREQTIAQYYADLQQAHDNARQAEYRLLAQGITSAGTNPAPSQQALPAGTGQDAPPQPLPHVSFAPDAARLTTLPALLVQQPIVEAVEEKDFTFKTNAATQVFYNEPVPGVSYRIQVGIFSRKLDPKELKQFTPVFAVAQGRKWSYAIGSFPLFSEAQKQLPVVKRRFGDALIVAFKDGKSIDVKQARIAEGKNQATSREPAPEPEAAYRIALGEYPAGLPKSLLKTVQQATDKDIVRAVVNGKTEYVVGPYARKSDADRVLDILHRNGFTKVQLTAGQ